MMKEIFKRNKLNIFIRKPHLSFLKSKLALFSTTTGIQRTLELEKNEEINNALKHKNFVSKK